MKQLKRKQYREFVEYHILRPYQSMVPELDTSRDARFSKTLYSELPRLFDENPEWTDLVFDRIARIFDAVEGAAFPSGQPAHAILSEMERRGVRRIGSK